MKYGLRLFQPTIKFYSEFRLYIQLLNSYGYFDTHIGAKQDVIAYQNILKHIQLSAKTVLFLSDVAEELDAAQTAGMQTCQLLRENLISTQSRHIQVHNFEQILV